ncbi:MAG: threonine synthase [Bacteroidetes bacterium]|nr:threonine synthase [Bacteroidota bacterium]
MIFRSTRHQAPPVSAEKAILTGLAPDGGLYVPSGFPSLSPFPSGMQYPELATLAIQPFFNESSEKIDIGPIIRDALNFEVPLNFFGKETAVLELFHGPTAAFKDVGARFLAGVMAALKKPGDPVTTIVVATSGDTGGAVASAFFRKPGFEVIILFPEGKVSPRQQQQLTCWGENISSYAVKGTFDDCQRLAKEAFATPSVAGNRQLSSANSINLGRLLPQMTYYIHASIGFRARTGQSPVIIIPSGNVGNAVGAVWAREMGAPIRKIVLAANANRTIPDFFDTGKWSPRPSVETLANAMDVGNPSNMERLRDLYPDLSHLKSFIETASVTDEEIRETIISHFHKTGMVICPHTAVAEKVRRTRFDGEPAMIVATAHPAKFETIVEPLIGQPVEIPPALAGLLHRPVSVRQIEPDLHQLFT